MIWTLLLLVIAIALYACGPMLLRKDGKKEMTKYAAYGMHAMKIVAIVLLVISVNRMGLGTTYYLTQKNPMILQEMAQNMQDQRQAEASREITKYIKKNEADMIKNAPILGDPNAKKVVFLFSAYSCPYCARAHKELERVVKNHPDVKVAIKEFSIHGVMSDDAARAVIAAKMQSNDKAAQLSISLMEKRYLPDDAKGKSEAELAKAIHKNVMDRAQSVGLSVAQLQEDMNSSTVEEELAQVRDLAQRFQIGGTPYIIAGGQAFPGAVPYDTIVKALK